MGFGFSGAAAGATKSLEDIVAQRMLAQRLEAEINDRQQRSELEQSRFNETVKQNDFERQQASRPTRDPLMDYEARKQVDQKYEKPAVIKSERDPISDYKARKEIDRQYDKPAVVKPERDPIKDYEERLKLDAKYKPTGTGGSAANPAEATKTAGEVSRIAGDLLKHPGFGGAFGVVDAMMPTVRQDTADAESLRDALTSLLTLENMGKMKGVLSDSDMKIIRQASTSLNPRMGDAAARSELTRIQQVMDRAGHMPSMNLETSHATGAPIQQPIPGIAGGIAESTDGGKTWHRVK